MEKRTKRTFENGNDHRELRYSCNEYCITALKNKLCVDFQFLAYKAMNLMLSLCLEDIKDPENVWADRGWILQNLDFVTDQHQINVGITQSKFGLVSVGKYTCHA